MNALLDGVKKKMSSESGSTWVMSVGQLSEVDSTVFGFIVGGFICSYTASHVVFCREAPNSSAPHSLASRPPGDTNRIAGGWI